MIYRQSQAQSFFGGVSGIETLPFSRSMSAGVTFSADTSSNVVQIANLPMVDYNMLSTWNTYLFDNVNGEVRRITNIQSVDKGLAGPVNIVVSVDKPFTNAIAAQTLRIVHPNHSSGFSFEVVAGSVNGAALAAGSSQNINSGARGTIKPIVLNGDFIVSGDLIGDPGPNIVAPTFGFDSYVFDFTLG